MEELKKCSSKWEQTYDVIRDKKDRLSAMHQKECLKLFRKFCDNVESPSLHHIIEYAFYIIKKRGTTSRRFINEIRYIQKAEPLIDNTPRFVAAFVKCDLLLTTEEVIEIIEMMPSIELKAYAAISAAGFKWQRMLAQMKNSDYDPVKKTAFSIKRLPDWINVYMMAQYELGVKHHRLDSDNFFFRIKRDGTPKNLIHRDFLHQSRIVRAKTGKDIIKHNWLYVQMYAFDPKLPINFHPLRSTLRKEPKRKKDKMEKEIDEIHGQ